MGYWLAILFVLFIGIVIIDNSFDKLNKKIPYYVLLTILVFGLSIFGYQQWQQRTLHHYELTQSYLIINYLSGEREHIAYQDIEQIKYYQVGKTGTSCGLSFYIKGKTNLRTLGSFRCQDIGELKQQIQNKRKSVNIKL
jgi:hypothetical protein